VFGGLFVLTNPVVRFRVLSFVEGWSFVVLLVFGSLLSRISSIDLVMPLGIAHGALFVALVAATLAVRPVLEWSTRTTLLALLAAVLPLGPFVFHYAKRSQLRPTP
jgi:integral membrane protein